MMTFMTQKPVFSALEHRIHGVAVWLDDAAPYAQFDQRHLDTGTPEQAYWHLGYVAALRDALQLLRDAEENTSDTSSQTRATGQDE